MKSEANIGRKESVKAEEIIGWVIEQFHPNLALACSFSPEDIAIAHMMSEIRQNVRIFALDTGRLNEETYECADAVRKRLRVTIEWFFPNSEAVENLEREKGLFSFRESLENRHECCQIRKVEPLSRALSGLEAWVTGLRQEQSVTRTQLEKIERDDAHGGIVKINPLADWSSEKVWEYIKKFDLPYNRLNDQGYPSIGCAPCTRAIEMGEDPRAGRWWWEHPDHKECGLHVSAGKNIQLNKRIDSNVQHQK